MNSTASLPGKKQRSSNLELLRIFSMLLIVLHHWALYSGFDYAFDSLAWPHIFVRVVSLWGKMGINCFILISGYFLMDTRFSVTRTLRLWLQIAFYSVGCYLFAVACGLTEYSVKALFGAFFPVLTVQYGFVSQFFLLMLLAPLVRAAVQRMTQKEHFNVIIILLIIYSIIPSLFYGVPFYFSNTLTNDLLWFITLYLIATYIALYPCAWTQKCGKNFLLAALAALVVVCICVGQLLLGQVWPTAAYHATDLTDYTRFSVFLTSLFLFLGFKNLPVKNSRIINAIAGGTFGVFLLHENNYLRDAVWALAGSGAFAQSPLLPLAMLGAVLGVFLGGVIIDLVRKTLLEKPLFALLGAQGAAWQARFARLQAFSTRLVNSIRTFLNR